MVAVEISRLLRRGLLVTVVAAAGWLLSAVFAGSAGADELPGDHPHAREQSSGGLIGGLVGGLAGITDAVVDITGSVVDTTTTLLAPIERPSPGPIVDVPALLPADDWTSGTTETVRADPPAAPAPVALAAPAEPASWPVAPAPSVPAAAPAAPVVRQTAAPATKRTATEEKSNEAGQHAGHGTDPQPAKNPAGPATPVTAAASAYDNQGGTRGAHGVLISHATPAHPEDAGFTTRSRAVNAAGRDTGLPAATPD